MRLAIAILLSLFPVLVSSACLDRNGHKKTIQNLEVGARIRIIKMHEAYTSPKCNSDACVILRDDKITLEKDGKLSWVRKVSGKDTIIRSLSMHTVKKIVDNNTTVSYMKSAPHDGYEYYVYYKFPRKCEAIDNSYNGTGYAGRDCSVYSFESFPISVTSVPPLDFVRPEDSSGTWSVNNCTGGVEPNTGGGHEPP